METKSLEKKQGTTIYCHFSFKRPTGKNYGVFAVAFYKDFAGKKLITYTVKKFELWKNHQFVTAIQSYENALLTVYENQGMMKQAGINQIMLVTDNSTLAGWIVNPKKNKNYSEFMEKAVKPYRAGSFKEIVLGIGLCEPREAEKSYKYCKEELVTNDYKEPEESVGKNNSAGYKIELKEYDTVLDILEKDKSIPKISGINSL